MNPNQDDVNTQVEQPQTATETSTVETQDTAMTTDFDSLWDKETPKPEPEQEVKIQADQKEEPAENQAAEDDSKVENGEKGDESKTPEQGDDQQNKRDANARIRQLANENRDLRQQIEQATAQHYQAQTKDELIEQGLSEADARVEALEQRLEMDKFNAHVTQLNTALEAESQQVLRDFPMFDPQSDQYKPEIAEQVQNLYQKASGLKLDDKTGFYTEANVLPYDFYKTFANSYQISRSDGEVAGQKAAQKNYAAADMPSSTPPKPTAKDPIVSIWESDD